jgi:hypothetical protein
MKIADANPLKNEMPVLMEGPAFTFFIVVW